MFAHSKTIADAWLGDDEPGAGRIVFNFLTQMADMHPQVLSFFHIFGTPHGGQHLAMGQDTLGVLGHKPQDFVLVGR